MYCKDISLDAQASSQQRKVSQAEPRDHRPARAAGAYHRSGRRLGWRLPEPTVRVHSTVVHLHSADSAGKEQHLKDFLRKRLHELEV